MDIRRACWSWTGRCSRMFIHLFAADTLSPTGRGAVDLVVISLFVLTHHRGGTHCSRASTTPTTMHSRLLLLLAMSALVACRNGDRSNADAGGTVIMTVGAEPDALLPITTTSVAGNQV